VIRRYASLGLRDDEPVPTPDFRFEVEEAFNITGRGTAVVGRLVSGHTTGGEPLCLHADGSVLRIDEVFVEFMYKEGSDQRALMLRGVSKEQVPPGSVLLPCD
jgi:translation elongation factor EF-Tu-like GTPase